MPSHSSFTAFFRVIDSLIKWTEEEIAGFEKHLSIAHYKKGSYLLTENTVCDNLWFLNSGIGRVFSQAKKDRTFHFIVENNFVADMGGLLFGHKSPIHIQLLEDAEVVVIPRSTLQWIYEHIAEGEKLGRILYEQGAVNKMEKIYDFYFFDPLQQFQRLILRYPDIEQRISQKIIASYLNITPTHLSRLKATQRKGT